MVKRLLVAWVGLSSCLALAESRNLDLFTHSNVSRAVVDVRALSPEVQQRVREGRIASVEQRLGVPTFFWAARSSSGRSLRDVGLTPEQAARRYLYAYGELYRQDPRRIAEARVAQVHDLGDGAVIVAFQEDEGGVRVFRDELKVVMNQRLELVALSGYFTPERKQLGAFALTPVTAIGAAYRDLSGHALDGTQLLDTGKVEGGYQHFALTGEATPVRARKVLFPLTDGLEPGYYLELQLSRAGTTGFDYSSYVVSARDGRLLFRKNLTAKDAFTYRVWADGSGARLPLDGPQGNAPSPHPTGTPNQFNPPFIAPSLVTLQNGPISTNDAWLPATAQDTRGNNAQAYADLAAPTGFSTGDLRASITSTQTFDRTYDVNQNPGVNADQRMAAITQLFYNVNLFHDWYYDRGFDERAGNGQKDNYGRGGIAGDELYAEAEDYSGRNNADMSTPSDGAHPVMQMYLFDGPAGQKVHVNGVGARDVNAGVADFGPQVFGVTADVALVDDGDPTGGTITDACQQNFNSNVNGKIALIDRGDCIFTAKVQNAQANGAVAVIIANNTGGGAMPLVGTAANVTIPALSISKTDGTSLKAALLAGTVNLTVSRIATTDRDGTIDNAIVAHEWGHYISNRLIGDGNGISNNQAVGMGEGWADFHAMLMVVKEGDDLIPSNLAFNGVYALAAYTSAGQDPNGYYYGIRRVPYSTDMTKNGLTFKHIADGNALPANVPTSFDQNGANNSEAHNTGEVWATALWECYASLLRDSGRLSFQESLDRMRGYIVASYKLTPLMPTMLEARDAVLAAAAAKDPLDFALFSAAFAKRGMGIKAVAPDRDSPDNSPVVESYLTGNDVGIVSVKLDDSVSSCDHDGILDNSEKGHLVVTLKNVGTGDLAATTAVVTTSSPELTFTNGNLITFPTSHPFGTVTGTIEVSLKNATGMTGVVFNLTVNDPQLATATPVLMTAPFRVNFDAKAAGATMDDVEAPTTLWTSDADPNGNTGSNWRRFEASATDHYWFGPDPSSPADTWLISPPLEVSPTVNFLVTFQHRWDFEGTPAEYFDGGVVEISTNNGQTWVDLGAALSPAYNGTLSSPGSNPLAGKKAFVGKSPGYPAFLTETIDLGSIYAGKTVKLRFRIGSDDAAAAKGWEIDDIGFKGLSNKPFPVVQTDPNACTNAPPVLTVGPDQTAPERSKVTLVASATDPDGDQVKLAWTQTDGPAVVLTGNGFTAPDVPGPTVLTFVVTASDGKATVGPVESHVTIIKANRPPVAIAPAAITVAERGDVVLTGSGTDPDGDPIAGYAWVQVSGPPVSLDGLATASAHFVAPEVVADTKLVFALTVSDGKLRSAPAPVEVTVLNSLAPPDATPPAKKAGCGCNSSAEAAPLLGFALLALTTLRGRRRK